MCRLWKVCTRGREREMPQVQSTLQVTRMTSENLRYAQNSPDHDQRHTSTDLLTWFSDSCLFRVWHKDISSRICRGMVCSTPYKIKGPFFNATRLINLIPHEEIAPKTPVTATQSHLSAIWKVLVVKTLIFNWNLKCTSESANVSPYFCMSVYCSFALLTLPRTWVKSPLIPCHLGSKTAPVDASGLLRILSFVRHCMSQRYPVT